MSDIAQWERWSVLVAAAGVLVSMLGLWWSGWQQVRANRDQAAAAEFAAEAGIRDALVDGGRRFTEARAAENQDLEEFESLSMLFRIEMHQQYLERFGFAGGSSTLSVGVLRQLAEAFCGPAELAGPRFADLGFPLAGKLADKHKLMTPGRPCPED